MLNNDQLIEDIAVAHDAIDATHDIGMVRLSPARLRRILEAATKIARGHSSPAPSSLPGTNQVQVEARTGSEAYWTALKQVIVSEESLYAEIRKAFEHGYISAHETRRLKVVACLENQIYGSVQDEQADIN